MISHSHFFPIFLHFFINFFKKIFLFYFIFLRKFLWFFHSQISPLYISQILLCHHIFSKTPNLTLFQKTIPHVYTKNAISHHLFELQMMFCTGSFTTHLVYIFQPPKLSKRLYFKKKIFFPPFLIFFSSETTWHLPTIFGTRILHT